MGEWTPWLERQALERCEAATPGPWLNACEITNIVPADADFIDHARDDLPDAIEELRRVRGQRDRALGIDQPWPLVDVLRRLVDAVEHLKRDHQCDRHGYEEDHECIEAAKRYAAVLAVVHASETSSASAEVVDGGGTPAPPGGRRGSREAETTAATPPPTPASDGEDDQRRRTADQREDLAVQVSTGIYGDDRMSGDTLQAALDALRQLTDHADAMEGHDG